LVLDLVIRDPQWLAGFTGGEGCFFVNITKSNTHSLGYQVTLKFQLTQHSRDLQLMMNLVEYFNCGILYNHKTKEAVDYIVVKFSDLTWLTGWLAAFLLLPDYCCVVRQEQEEEQPPAT
jgi:hypothetical protein